MSVAHWRGAAVIPVLVLMAMPLAHAADAPAVPGPAVAPASTAALPTGPPTASAPSGSAVASTPGPAADASEPESVFPDLLAPLRKFGVESWGDVV